jgi:predicted O-methyltransferase YrrM
MVIQKLKELEKESKKRKIPIIGSEKAEWLLNKIKQYQPQKILEFGTANGYSGIILGSQGAELITIEISENIAEEAAVNFSKYNINAKIIIGDGVKLAKELAYKNPENFDLIFIDFVKSGYLQILEPCITLLKNGGLIIADNISFEKCQDFRKIIQNHPLLKTEIIGGFKLTLKEGMDEMSISIKK